MLSEVTVLAQNRNPARPAASRAPSRQPSGWRSSWVTSASRTRGSTAPMSLHAGAGAPRPDLERSDLTSPLRSAISPVRSVSRARLHRCLVGACGASSGCATSNTRPNGDYTHPPHLSAPGPRARPPASARSRCPSSAPSRPWRARGCASGAATSAAVRRRGARARSARRAGRWPSSGQAGRLGVALQHTYAQAHSPNLH